MPNVQTIIAMNRLPEWSGRSAMRSIPIPSAMVIGARRHGVGRIAPIPTWSRKEHEAVKGSDCVSVIDFATQMVVRTWPIPDGGSPGTGNVGTEGTPLRPSGRNDDVAHAIKPATFVGRKLPGGAEPHRLNARPRPGRHPAGHAGIGW